MVGWAVAVGGVAHAAGCCHLPIEYEAFTGLSAQRKVEAWERVVTEQKGLCHVDRHFWLDALVVDGNSAVEHLIPILYEQESRFPVEDALHVIKMVALQGRLTAEKDVRAALGSLIVNHEEAKVRREAAEIQDLLEAR